MIPLYKPYIPALPEIEQVLYSGQLATGKYTQLFERHIQSYIDERYVLATNTFSSSIAVAVTAAGLKSGDTVIASPMACLASTQSFFVLGINIRWADVDPDTGTLDPDSVRKMITKGTKAIVHNHFCGYPGHVDEINRIARERGLIVIDDGIECFGTTYKQRLIGNCGSDITVFSFNPVRILTTIDGGAVIFNNREMYEKAILIRDCGIDRQHFRDDLGEIDPCCDISTLGYSATLSNVNAYIGLQQFMDLEKRLEKQRNNAKKWESTLSDSQYKPLEPQNGNPNYWVFGIRSGDKRECIKFFREHGYYASGVHINNNIYSIFGAQVTLPGVNEFNNTFVALPSGWWVNEGDIFL